MSAYDPQPWHDFAVATASASAALVGLLFVGVSINLATIIALPHFPGRAAYALVLLAAPVFVSLAVLVPQDPTALGIELVVISAVVGPVLGWLVAPGHRPPDTPVVAWACGVAAPALVFVLGVLLSGIGLWTASLGGLAWLPAAVALAFAGGLFNAWVLTIEIVR